MKYISLFLFLILFLNGCDSSINDADVEWPKATIQYLLPYNSEVKLTLENSHHTIVKILVNEVQSAGVHSVEFDTINLTIELYFYTLTARSIEGNSYYQITRAVLLHKG